MGFLSQFYPDAEAPSAYGLPYRSMYERGYRGIIFDIDNTLYSYDKAHEQAFPKLTGYAEAELGIPEAEFMEAYSREYAAVRKQLGETAAIHNRLIRIQRVLEKRG